MLHQLHFAAQRNLASSRLKGASHDFSQHLHNFLDIALATPSGSHPHGFQRIIKEMGVNLACQHLKFRVLLLNGKPFRPEPLLIDLRKEPLYLVNHSSQIVVQIADFVAPSQLFLQLEIPRRRFLHLGQKPFHPSAEGAGKQNNYGDGRYGAQDIKRHTFRRLRTHVTQNILISLKAHHLQIILRLRERDCLAGHHILISAQENIFLNLTAFFSRKKGLYLLEPGPASGRRNHRFII